MALSAYVARVYGARAVAREIGESREERVEKGTRGANWARGLYIVDCRMYIGCWKLGSFRVFGSATGPRRRKLGSFCIIGVPRG